MGLTQRGGGGRQLVCCGRGGFSSPPGLLLVVQGFVVPPDLPRSSAREMPPGFARVWRSLQLGYLRGRKAQLRGDQRADPVPSAKEAEARAPVGGILAHALPHSWPSPVCSVPGARLCVCVCAKCEYQKDLVPLKT